MKRIMKNSILLLAVLIISLMSCTIQKRHHLPGYYIQMNKKYKSSAENSFKQKEPANKMVINNEHDHAFISAQSIEKKAELTASTPIKETKTSIVQSKKEVTNIPETVGHQKGIEEATVKAKSIKLKPSAVTAIEEAQESSNQSGLFIILSLMGLTTAGAVIGKRKSLNKITRWAKKNPLKAQTLIASIQVPLLAGSIITGYNLKMLGFDFSKESMYVFGALAALSFAVLPFLPKSGNVILQKKVTRKRMAVIGVTLSSMMLLAGFGNRIHEIQPDSFISNSIEQVDQSIFVDNTMDTSSIDLNVQSDNEKNQRQGAVAGFVLLGVFLTIFLAFAICGGICLAAFGGSLVMTFLGLFMSIMAIVGIVLLWKSINRKIKNGAIGGVGLLGVFLTIFLSAAIFGGISLVAFGGGIGMALLGVLIAIAAIVGIVLMWIDINRQSKVLETE